MSSIAVTEERKRYNEQLVHIVYDKVWDNLITCNGAYEMGQTELSFRWEINGDDVMQRYKKFRTREEFLLACKTSRPHTIQLGAVLPDFPVHPSEELGGEQDDPDRYSRKRSRNLCKEQITSGRGPLVLDIDLTDYNRDNICSCIKAERRCCDICFSTLLNPAMEIVQYILCELFGFTKTFFVWSGGRGIHTWILDEQVIEWTDDQRTTFIERISKMEDDVRVQEILGNVRTLL